MKRHESRVKEHEKIKRWQAKYSRVLAELIPECIRREIIVKKKQKARTVAEK
jgi:hypothetical protein